MRESTNMTQASSRISLDDAVNELTLVMKNDPESVDRKMLRVGEDLLAIFLDTPLSRRAPEFAEKQRLTFRDAIEDLANGANHLARGAIGIKYEDGVLVSFVQLSSDSSPLNTVFSIRLKKSSDFQAWRRGEGIELPEALTNSCIYYLISLLARS